MVSLISSGISNLSRFTNLTVLYCSDNKLLSLPTLPESLSYLDCCYNQLTSLPILPTLPDLYIFHCHHNQLTTLLTVPNYLEDFDCSYNQLKSLPTLSDNLKQLTCHNNPFYTKFANLITNNTYLTNNTKQTIINIREYNEKKIKL